MFKIIFLGDLVDADKRSVVVRNLATLFGSTAGTLDGLFAQSPVVLKKNLNRKQAIRFRDAIVRCGAYCRIETMDSGSGIDSVFAEESADEHTECPRCGERQLKSPLCRHCGVLMQEYRGIRDAAVEVRSQVIKQESEAELNRRYYERRQDIETAVNIDDRNERRKGRDRRRAHLNWRM